MTVYEMEFDLRQVQELQNAINKFGAANKSVLPYTSASVYKAAQYVQNVWSNYVYGGGGLDGLEPLEKPLKPNRGDFRIENNGDFSASVKTDSKKIEEIEKGTNPVYYDMKEKHPYGKKSRVSKDGIPYLIIPFRWGTPNKKGTARAHFNNVIPQAEYRTTMLPMELSNRLNSTHFEKNANGLNIRRSEYLWGGRLRKEDAWDNRSVGMVRSIGYEWSKNGKIKATSTYFTFRIISAKSPANSWLYWKDGKDAKNMLEAVARTAKNEVESIIETGVIQDLNI